MAFIIKGTEDFRAFSKNARFLSFYVNDEYVPIITRSILAYEEFTPIEIDMNSITSNYGTSYPLNVQYRLNYTDLSGFYENTIKDGSFNVYKLSDYIVEIPSVRFNEGEQVYIPITIKDTARCSQLFTQQW